MSENQATNEPDGKADVKRGRDVVKLVTLSGVLALMVVSFLIWLSVDRIQMGIDSRLSRIERKLAQLSGEANEAAEQNQPPRRGLDPSRVYEINVAGAPAKGPAHAPITIVEFSDFQ
jgi:hypothetical protein